MCTHSLDDFAKLPSIEVAQFYTSTGIFEIFLFIPTQHILNFFFLISKTERYFSVILIHIPLLERCCD
jgi:hypothetical protein